MKWLKDLNNADLKKLSPYARNILNALKTVLDKFDLNKLDDRSKIEILKRNDLGTLHIDLIPYKKEIFGLNLYASESQCILGYCNSEQLECHSDPDKDAKYLKSEVLKAFENYLNGITLLQHYNQSGKIIKTLNYWGIDTENQPDKFIGTNALLFSGFSKTKRVKKITFHFKR